MEKTDRLNKQGKANIFITRTRKHKLAFLGTLMGILFTFLLPDSRNNYSGASLVPWDMQELMQLGAFEIRIPTMQYGFAIDTFSVREGTVERGQTLGAILSAEGLPASDIEKLIQHSKGIFDIRRSFRIGRKYTVLRSEHDGRPLHFIYEPNVLGYVVFDLTGDMQVRQVEYPVELRRRLVEGRVETTLWDALTASDVNLEAVSLMEDALQSAVDFSQTRVNDAFKLLYDEKFIEGSSIGAGKVYAAYYQREGRESYVFWFDDGTHRGYFDQDGRPTKKAFLRAPLKYSRISSRFNPARFHPVLKKVRPHLGTDYAAPHGTPIYAVGDGVVVEAAFTANNGRYVKIRHDNVYQTQYLHMSGFAKGIKPGVPVSQGDVIGYVGSTGLATGPHVCFRFWKNGRQVNHLKENLPSVKQLPEEALAAFFEVRDRYLRILHGEEAPDAAVLAAPVEAGAVPGEAGTALP